MMKSEMWRKAMAGATIKVFLDVSNFANQGRGIREIRVSSSATVQQLLPQLLKGLSLPVIRSDGLPLTYHLCFAGRRLLGDRTLAQQGIIENRFGVWVRRRF